MRGVAGSTYPRSTPSTAPVLGAPRTRKTKRPQTAGRCTERRTKTLLHECCPLRFRRAMPGNRRAAWYKTCPIRTVVRTNFAGIGYTIRSSSFHSVEKAGKHFSFILAPKQARKRYRGTLEGTATILRCRCAHAANRVNIV